MKVDETELWTRSRAGDLDARNRLAKLHIKLAFKIARSTSRSIGGRVEYEDLVGAAAQGLIRAIDRFDPAEGNMFSTYAVPRVRGAVLDFLRSRDKASRTLRKRDREIREAAETMRQELEREPTDQELAERLQVDVRLLWKWKSALSAIEDVSLDQTLGQADEDDVSLSDVVEQEDYENPLDAVVQSERKAQLRRALETLPEREKQLLALYYFEDLTQADIGKILGLSEGRVSQLRSGAIKKLKKAMTAPDR